MPNKQVLFIILVIFGCSSPKATLNDLPTTGVKVPKNVILMIGDGMGLSQISAAMYSKSRSLNIEEFPYVGLQRTSCKDQLITDSAASAAAIARGIKANKNTFGTTEKSKAPPSILEILNHLGWATGMVVTSSLTHATPAAFVTYQAQRSMYEEIAKDFMNVDIDYLVGGGKQYFERRADERNLVEELQNKDVVIKSFMDGELQDISLPGKNRFIYFSADSEPLSHSHGRNYLTYACERGVSFLQKRSEKGFFMLVEGSQIDWGCHANIGELVVEELLDFDEAVGKMLSFAKRDGETLVIVTADHETGGLAIAGETENREPIIKFITKQHTASMVPVFAYGPGAEQFTGVYENTEISEKIKNIMKVMPAQ